MRSGCVCPVGSGNGVGLVGRALSMVFLGGASRMMPKGGFATHTDELEQTAGNLSER